MFAILVYDPDQLYWRDLIVGVQSWIRDAGGFAALALAIWCLAYVIQRPAGLSPHWSLQSRLFVLAVAGAALMYGLFFVFLFLDGTTAQQEKINIKTVTHHLLKPRQVHCLTLGGAFALMAALVPVLAGLGRLRWRRIWAIAKLSIKETVRQKILWVFASLLLLVLFGSWFLDTGKAEYQLRNYIWAVDWATTILLLLAASLLAAFSIPADVKSQTIHTVVTKPVERFEIVLGRFLGYTLLLSVVLVGVTSLALLYVFRSINEEAKKENYKARVPIYGTLTYKNTGTKDEAGRSIGENVGREYTHRSYIQGPGRGRATGPTQYAIWSFSSLPQNLADRQKGVICEFSFDIYRTHKGEEGKGIFCAFKFVSWRCRLNERMEAENYEEIKKAEDKLAQQGKTRSEIANLLADKYGIFEVPSKEVTDYHTQAILVPVGLLKNALRPEDPEALGASREGGTRLLQVMVNVTSQSPAQLVGVAKQDLYLLDDEKTFEENFFKAAFGLWFRLVLVIAIAVSCSTYLSGIISWLCTMFLFGLGLFKDFIQQLILGVNEGGGPLEAMLRLYNRQSIAAQPEQTPTWRVAMGFDEGFRWVLNLFMKLIPDVNRFDLSRFVANGFDISWTEILLVDNFIRLVGFVLPWLVLAYYLIKYREVANPT